MRRGRQQRRGEGGLEEMKRGVIVKSNGGERPEDKRIDRMWQRRDIQLQGL